MSKERIVLGAVLCFLSGVVLTQPPEWWVDVFSMPRLMARWMDAAVLACTGLWLGVAWASKQDATLAAKLADMATKLEQAGVQLNGCHAGLAQSQAVLQQLAMQLQKLTPPPAQPIVASQAIVAK